MPRRTLWQAEVVALFPRFDHADETDLLGYRAIRSGGAWEEARKNINEDANATWVNKAISIDNTRDAFNGRNARPREMKRVPPVNR
jgi:hypothetical protein